MNQNIIALISLFSISALVAYIFWLYRDYCVDSFRQRMFHLRDEFFDEAVKGPLVFESPAYGMLRTTMNGLIRFGHRLSLTQMIFSIFILKKHSRDGVRSTFGQQLEVHLNALDGSQRAVALKYYKKMNIILVRHLILSSPVMVVTILVPLSLLFFANKSLKRIVNALKGPIDNIDSLAYSEGEF